MRLTADFIWNTFLISGKKHLVITGNKGSGKTTLLNELFSPQTVGVTTFAEPQKAVYIKDNITKKTSMIGVYDPTLGGADKKMRAMPNGFIEVGIPALRCSMEGAGEWVTIDEIGYLEESCPEYCDTVAKLFEKKRVGAVVRKGDEPFCRSILSRDDVFAVDVDLPYKDLGCVIMASGEGKRFGKNKLTADFSGEAMIMKTIRATDGIFGARVVVTRHDDVYELCRDHGVNVIRHDMPFRSDTVRLGLKALTATKGCVFCQGDQPLLSQETLLAMSLLSMNNKNSIIRAAHDGVGGAPILFPDWMYPELLSLPEGKGGGYVAKKYSEHVLLYNVHDPHELTDVDTPEDLCKLLEYEKKLK